MEQSQTVIDVTPADGVFLPGLPDPDYRAIQAVSYSFLKHFQGVTPEEGKYLAHKPFKPTRETNLGNAFGELFEFGEIRMPVVLDGDGRKKEVKDSRVGIGDKFLTASDRALCLEMYEVCMSHPKISALMETHPERELSFTWTEGRRNTPAKGRSDIYSRDLRINLDWKTTSESLSDRSLKNLIADRLLHGQQGFYRRGIRAAGGEVEHCLLAFIRTVRPIQVRLIRLEDVDVQAGEDTMMRLLELYAMCSEVDVWPGHGTGIDSLLLPDWARK
jgi:hypothetical protein